jgi:hypothetical protein
MKFKNNSLYKTIISFSLVSCFLLSCWQTTYASRPAKPPRQVRVGHYFNLQTGQEVLIKGTGLRIKFTELNDSRCPRNVTCVWAGNAAVKLDVTFRGRDQKTITLNTTETQTMPREQDYHGYKLRLLAVNPYPVNGQPTKATDSVVTLKVSKR